MASFSQNIRLAKAFNPYRNREEIQEPTNLPSVRQNSNPMQLGQQGIMQPTTTPPMDVVLGDQGFQSGTDILRRSSMRQSPEFDLAKMGLNIQRINAETNAGYKQEQLKINQQKNQIAAFKAQNPNAIIKEVGGRMVAINPQNPSQITDLGDSRFMNEEDKIALLQTGKLEAIGATGDQSRETERLRQEGRLEVVGAQGNETRRTQAEGDSRLLPTQEAKQYQNKYNILINRRPEFRDFISLDENGMPIVREPSTSRFSFNRPTKQQFDEINQEIFGSVKGPATTSGVTPPIVEKTVKMKGPDNIIYDIPSAQVEDAKRNKMVLVE